MEEERRMSFFEGQEQRAFFKEKRNEKQAQFRLSYEAGVKACREVFIDVERRAMVLYASGVAKRLECFVKVNPVTRNYLNVVFYAKAQGYGPYRTVYRLGSVFVERDQLLDFNSFLHGFNNSMRKRNGLCFGASERRPCIV